MSATDPPTKKLLVAAVLLVAGAAGYFAWNKLRDSGPGAGFVSGNGRIEATEIDIATKLAGRVISIFVNEGDFVQTGQVLAQMQVDVLEAQREEARAQHQRSFLSAAREVALTKPVIAIKVGRTQLRA